MRLNVFLQKAGIGSRREAERMIEAGQVTVNGAKAQVTTPVEEGDEVRVAGKAVSVETRPVPRMFMLNKPVDVLVTNKDPEGRKTIFDLPVLKPPTWTSSMPRVMNVGRLDVNSEGLLLLTSDGPLAQKMMKPETGLKRVYRVRVHGRLKEGDLKKLAEGVTVDGIRYRGADVVEDREPSGRNTWYRIVLTEGKNREIRKLMEHFGCVVNRLIRVQYGPFELGTLPIGALREVPYHEVNKLIASLEGKAAPAKNKQ